ncbi:hypothetical protein FJTKL_01594 [Diaporthe vaccinii]
MSSSTSYDNLKGRVGISSYTDEISKNSNLLEMSWPCPSDASQPEVEARLESLIVVGEVLKNHSRKLPVPATHSSAALRAVAVQHAKD